MKAVAAALAILLISSQAHAAGGEMDAIPQGVMCTIKKVTVLAKSEADCIAIGGKVMFVIESGSEEKK